MQFSASLLMKIRLNGINHHGINHSSVSELINHSSVSCLASKSDVFYFSPFFPPPRVICDNETPTSRNRSKLPNQNQIEERYTTVRLTIDTIPSTTALISATVLGGDSSNLNSPALNIPDNDGIRCIEKDVGGFGSRCRISYGAAALNQQSSFFCLEFRDAISLIAASIDKSIKCRSYFKHT